MDWVGNLLEFLKEVEREAGGYQPSVVLESIGHYHFPVIQFLEEEKYSGIVMTEKGPFIFLIAIEIFIPIIRSIIIVRAILKKKIKKKSTNIFM